MKWFIAVTLVVVTMAAAEPPSRRIISQRQTAAPYEPRGWRPSGPSFNPTSNFQRQELAPAEPSPSYGPPPAVSYGPPEVVTTTEIPTTTEGAVEVTTVTDLQGEDLKSGLLRQRPKAEKLQNEPQAAQPGQVYVVLPQNQNYIYATAVRPLSAALVQAAEPKTEVEVIKEPKLAPVQAVPALAKIQAPYVLASYEQIPQVVQFQQIQAVPYAKYASALSQTAVHTPYSESFVQIYQ